jgi:hypothetical protein
LHSTVREVSKKIGNIFNDFRLNTWSEAYLRDCFSEILWYNKSKQEKIEMLRKIDVASF